MKKLPKLQIELPKDANMNTKFALIIEIRGSSNASSDVGKSRRAKELALERARIGKSRRQ